MICVQMTKVKTCVQMTKVKTCVQMTKVKICVQRTIITTDSITFKNYLTTLLNTFD